MSEPEITETSASPDFGSTTGRWQKVVGIIGLVVLLAVGARMVGTIGGGGGTGPGGHGPSVTEPATEDGGGHTPPSGIPEHSEQQP